MVERGKKGMTMWRSRAIAFLLLFSLGGCGEHAFTYPSYLRDDYAPPADSRGNAAGYVELDHAARQGVDPQAAEAALAGDRVVARTIGSQLADYNRMNEARYWFQIAAENGDGVAMQNLSVLLREMGSECVRANFWLKRALATQDFHPHERANLEKDWIAHSDDC